MFPFSFLSQVPLILFAALYLLYIGNYSLNKVKAAREENQLLANERFVKETAAGNSNCIYYSDNSRDNRQATIPSYKTILPDKPLIYLFVIIPDEKVSFNFFRSNTFSRPPPFLA